MILFCFYFSTWIVKKIALTPVPFEKTLRLSDSGSCPGKLDSHTNKLTLHILLYSSKMNRHQSVLSSYETCIVASKHTEGRQGKETHLCDRIIIECDLFAILNFTYSINSNLVMTTYSSNSAFKDKIIGWSKVGFTYKITFKQFENVGRG
jgi:hypothetical protein